LGNLEGPVRKHCAQVVIDDHTILLEIGTKASVPLWGLLFLCVNRGISAGLQLTFFIVGAYEGKL